MTVSLTIKYRFWVFRSNSRFAVFHYLRIWQHGSIFGHNFFYRFAIQIIKYYRIRANNKLFSNFQIFLHMSIFIIPATKTNAVIRFLKDFRFTRRCCVIVILNGLCLRDSFSFRICIDKCYCIFASFRIRFDSPIAGHIRKIICILPHRKAFSIILRNFSSRRSSHRFTSNHIWHSFQSFSIKALKSNRVNRAIAINSIHCYIFCHK